MKQIAVASVVGLALLAAPAWARAQDSAGFPQAAFASQDSVPSVDRAPPRTSGSAIGFPGVPAFVEASASDRVTVDHYAGAVPFSVASAYALRPDANVAGVWVRSGPGAWIRTAGAR